MNNIVLKGRLTADPELRYTPANIAVCNFSIAVNRRFDKEKTDFIYCQAWRNTAEFICKYFGKGKEILVNGELHIDNFTTKEGEKKSLSCVVIDAVEFCGSNTAPDKKGLAETQSTSADDYFGVDESDLPF